MQNRMIYIFNHYGASISLFGLVEIHEDLAKILLEIAVLLLLFFSVL